MSSAPVTVDTFMTDRALRAVLSEKRMIPFSMERQPFLALDEAVLQPTACAVCFRGFASRFIAPLTQQLKFAYGELRIGFMRHFVGNGQNTVRIIVYVDSDNYDNVKEILQYTVIVL